MVELQGLREPNGIVNIKDNNDTLIENTIRDLILKHSTDDQPTFLSVSKKWGSPM